MVGYKERENVEHQVKGGVFESLLLNHIIRMMRRTKMVKLVRHLVKLVISPPIVNIITVRSLFVCFVNWFGSARWRFAPQMKPPPETEVWPDCSHEFLINKNNFILPHIAPSS